MALKMQSPLDRVNDVKQLYPNDTTSTLSFDGFVTTENEIYRTIIKNRKCRTNNLRMYIFNRNILQKLHEIIYLV
jgi:hypothetical protein